jgi:hypothetical protein
MQFPDRAPLARKWNLLALSGDYRETVRTPTEVCFWPVIFRNSKRAHGRRRQASATIPRAGDGVQVVGKSTAFQIEEAASANARATGREAQTPAENEEKLPRSPRVRAPGNEHNPVQYAAATKPSAAGETTE